MKKETIYVGCGVKIMAECRNGEYKVVKKITSYDTYEVEAGDAEEAKAIALAELSAIDALDTDYDYDEIVSCEVINK